MKQVYFKPKRNVCARIEAIMVYTSGCSCTTPIKKSSGESSEENESWLHFAKVEFSDIGSKNFAVIFSIWDHHIPLQKVYRELFQGSQSFEISLNWAPGNLWRQMKRYFLIQFSIKCGSRDIKLLNMFWYLCSKYENMKKDMQNKIGQASKSEECPNSHIKWIF